MPTINVQLVDDSLFIRKSLRKILEADGEFLITGEASSVSEAIDNFKQSEPDLIITDIQLIGSNGIDYIRWVMKTNPKPILVLSGEINDTDAVYYEAVELGIIAFIKKDPSQISGILGLKTTILNSLQSGLRKSKITRSAGVVPSPQQTISADRQLILIGASTGGPQALEFILKDLPASLQWPIVVVQHMPVGFTASFASRLDSLSNLTINQPEFLTELKPGNAYIGKAGFHLNVGTRGTTLWASLNENPADSLHKPSVDELFLSAAQLKNSLVHAFLLTGMGSDGAKGLIELRKRGHKTFTQLGEECVVDGMPRIARELGGSMREMSLAEIQRYILALK